MPRIGCIIVGHRYIWRLMEMDIHIVAVSAILMLMYHQITPTTDLRRLSRCSSPRLARRSL